MIQNFRLLNLKDIENPFETVIPINSIENITILTNSKKSTNVTNQKDTYENFDNYIEKRK